jgi:hypothetical protein
MVMTYPEDKSGPPSVNIRVRLWHPGFWLFWFRAWAKKAIYNWAFEWVHRNDDHVRVWQNGERCPGCEGRDA